jgi:large subunit ribosomal protein L15
MRRQYPPLSLLSLQRMVDLGRVDPDQPIDLTTICNTKVVTVDPMKKHYGVHLTDDVS